MRPTENYVNEMIFPIGPGKIISLRNDGPYAQVIIEHKNGNLICWSVYEHIAGISATLGQQVNPNEPIGRFMNKEELNLYGWQFNHLHLEILRIPPRKIIPDLKNPYHFYFTYNLDCFTKEELNSRYYDPFEFFKANLLKQ